MATFVLNDESVINSYGFRIPNSGINLARFKANPVMLDQHTNSTAAVLGRWKNIRVSGSQLLADDDFDTADPAAMLIKGKVDRGFVKGASMGVTFDHTKMLSGKDNILKLTACELFESSICAVPSNASALRLYVASTGELMSEDEVKVCLSALTNKGELKNTNMDLLKALIDLLQLPADATADDVITAIKEMQKANETLSEKELSLALDSARISLTQREFFTNAAKQNLQGTIAMLNTFPRSSDKLLTVVHPSGTATIKEDRSKWTLDDYREKDPEALLKDQKLYKTLCLQAGIKEEI